jgi:hypothetical protein
MCWALRMPKSVSLSVLALLLSVFAPPASAAVITFESLPTNPNGGVPVGSPIVDQGFQLSTLGMSNFAGFQEGWQNNRGASNGTTSLRVASNINSAGFRLAATDSSAFDIQSMDLGELFRPGDFAFAGNARTVTFTGMFAAGGTISTTFNLDLLADGPGGISDFQHLAFTSAWSGLSFLDVAVSNPTTIYGVHLLVDNITVNESRASVPEPTTAALMGLGLLGTLVRRRRATR